MKKEIYKPGTKVYLDGRVDYYFFAGEHDDSGKKVLACTVVSDRVRQMPWSTGDGKVKYRDYIIVAREGGIYRVYLNNEHTDLRLLPVQRTSDCEPGMVVKLTSDALKWQSKLKHLEGEKLLVGSYVYYDEETREACVNLTWRCGGLIKLGIGTVGPWDYLKKIRED